MELLVKLLHSGKFETLFSRCYGPDELVDFLLQAVHYLHCALLAMLRKILQGRW